MIRRLCIVLGHGGSAETIRRHLPIWRKWHDRVIVCVPADDNNLFEPDTWVFVYGRSARYSAQTNKRTIELIKLACSLMPSFTTFVEYDALLWRWPEELIAKFMAHTGGGAVAFGSVFQNADPKFKARFYIHSPIIFTIAALCRTLWEMKKLPADAEGGFGDRLFGLAIENAGIRVVDGHEFGLSYSQNEITPENVANAVAAIKAGVCFTHGVKDEAILRRLVEATGIQY